jgi:two-component system NtrC family sensor kinase
MELDSHVKLKAGDEIGELAREFNEMTDRLRQAQNEYRQLTETLEAKVEARTAEISDMHAHLVRTEKLASLGQLVAGIAHEINNPLSGILMFANLFAEDRTLPQEKRDDAMIIVRETQRCAAIVKRLLEFSRNSIPHKKSTSLAKIMDDTLSLLEHQATLSNIEIFRLYDATLPNVEVDPDQIEQVFVNMVVNACQAMPQGGQLTVTIRADFDSRCIITTIEDTGQGIPKEHLEKIFDPFFTTKDQPVNGMAGTGLGLSVSYGIVQNHGGRIDVASHVGIGTVFTVELPLAGQLAHPAEEYPYNVFATG